VTRRVGRGTAGLLGAALVLLCGSIAVASPSSRLTGQDLPTSAQLAAVYPSLAGGSRTVSPVPTIIVAGARDCLGLHAIGMPRSGVWARFYDAAGGDLYAAGGEIPLPAVYEFATERDARQMMRQLGRYLERCAGHHISHGSSDRLTTLPDPGLGDKSVAYLLSGRYFNSTNGRFTRRELHVVVRRGNLVVDGYLAAERLVPSLDHGVWLATLTLDSSS
jgi:hypothetical protein